MRKPLGLNKSFIISLCIHILLLTFLTLTFAVKPQKELNEPVTINIEPLGESLPGELGNTIFEPVPKEKEKEQKRITKEIEKTAVPDNASARNESPQDNIKKDIAADTKGELNKEAGSLSTNDSEKLNREETKRKIDREMKDIFGALEQGNPSSEGLKGISPSGDPLGDASWSSKPRKTTFFPDIQSKIPENYKKKGLSYSITVKLTFDKNGLASGAEIVSSSGDSEIDSIFATELRKVRVEPIDEDRNDVIIKVFKISLK